MNQIPLILINNRNLSRVFIGIGEVLSSGFSGLDSELRKAGINQDKKEFISVLILNSLVYFLLFSVLFSFLLYGIRGFELSKSIILSMAISLGVSILIFFVMIVYPKILAGKRAELVEKNLIFVLKDLTLQVNSGVPLFDSILNISKSNYGIVSQEFEIVISEVNSGKSIEKALLALATQSSSEFLRRAVWQIVNTMKAGASIKGTLKGILSELVIEQRNRIMNYSRELNMWILIYMLFAVAIPTIGATMLIIISRFGEYNLDEKSFAVFALANFAVQFVLIGFIKSRRPIVNM